MGSDLPLLFFESPYFSRLLLRVFSKRISDISRTLGDWISEHECFPIQKGNLPSPRVFNSTSILSDHKKPLRETVEPLAKAGKIDNGLVSPAFHKTTNINHRVSCQFLADIRGEGTPSRIPSNSSVVGRSNWSLIQKPQRVGLNNTQHAAGARFGAIDGVSLSSHLLRRQYSMSASFLICIMSHLPDCQQGGAQSQHSSDQSLPIPQFCSHAAFTKDHPCEHADDKQYAHINYTTNPRSFHAHVLPIRRGVIT